MSTFLRHQVLRLLLKTTRRHMICEVEMEKCLNPLGFSFGESGWHFIVEFLKEHDANPGIPMKKSILYRYHNTYQPASMAELVAAAGMNVAFNAGFFRYPWGDFRTDFNHMLPEKDRYNSRFCGPSDDTLIENNILKILELKDSIESMGYNPWRYPNTFIGGVFLRKENKDYRCVVLQGNHRVAVMSYLGIQKFQARFQPNLLPCINESDIGDWYYVKRGMCSIADAKKYFDAFFILSGKERALRSIYVRE